MVCLLVLIGICHSHSHERHIRLEVLREGRIHEESHGFHGWEGALKRDLTLTARKPWMEAGAGDGQPRTHVDGVLICCEPCWRWLR